MAPPPKPIRRRPRTTTRAEAGASAPTSIAQVDLRPPPGRTYFQSEREWREGFIYFLMVDRFHDDQPRTCPSRARRSSGVGKPHDFYVRRSRGITRTLH